MNDQEKILRTAAERLLAVADGATLEWASGYVLAYPIESYDAATLASNKVRIRPPAAPPEPKPSQAVLDACKRLGVEAWKLDRYKAGDESLYPGFVTEDGVCCYGSNLRIEKSRDDQKPDSTARYWHVRPIAQAKPPELPVEYAPHPMGERKPELPCPPRPTPEQVAAARMPDGRKVKPPTVCEEPNGRAYFNASDSAFVTMLTKPDERFGKRRWIAEPAEDVVTPWDFKTLPRPFPTLSRWGCDYEIVAANPAIFVTIGGDGRGWNIVRHDWEDMKNFTHNGQPCGEVAK